MNHTKKGLGVWGNKTRRKKKMTDYDYDDVLFLLDASMRSCEVPLSIFFNQDDYQMYLECDLNVLLEYSRKRFLPFLTLFTNPYELRKIRMVTFFLTIKQYTDIILVRPFTYAWTVTVGSGHLPFVESCDRFVNTLVCLEPCVLHTLYA